MASDRATLEGWRFPDRFRIGSGLSYDPAMRARGLSDSLVRSRHGGEGRGEVGPLSDHLTRLGELLQPKVLQAADRACKPTAGQEGEGEAEVAGQGSLFLASSEFEHRVAQAVRRELSPWASEEQVGLASQLGVLSARLGTSSGGCARLWEEIVARTDEIFQTAGERRDGRD